MRRPSLSAAIVLMLPGAGFIALFLAAALGMSLLQSVGYYNMTGPSGFSLQYWGKVFSSQVWDSFVYSVWIGTASAFGTLVLAYPLALFLRRRTPWNAFMNTLLRVPLFMPALVAAFILVNIMDYNGLINGTLVGLGLIEKPVRMLRNEWGAIVILIQIWKNVPFQLLIIASVVQTIRTDIEEAAYNLGAGRFEVFRHILLPLSMPGIMIAVVLVFIGAFGDFAINTIAGPTYPPPLAVLMVTSANLMQEWNFAACIGVLIMAVSIVFVFLYTRLARAIQEAEA
ncbi:MAG: ABC transporter permease [Alphaproteobacteria bacterium]|nr:ABC transporter permease [Alphaproteobacteria bacterium]